MKSVLSILKEICGVIFYLPVFIVTMLLVLILFAMLALFGRRRRRV